MPGRFPQGVGRSHPEADPYPDVRHPRRRPGTAPAPKPPYPQRHRTSDASQALYHAPRVPEARIPFTSIRDER